MNLMEDEPRKVPKPVPFSENSSFHPAVPEVSLILQETTKSPNVESNKSFSGTEFQTYNAWRWKQINEKEKENLNFRQFCHNKKEEFYPINDKFSGSDIEKRKNEILYGNCDEPRRPLPPRQIPAIPKYFGLSFSDESSLNENWPSHKTEVTSLSKGSFQRDSKSPLKPNRQEIRSDKSSTLDELIDIKGLYHIISEQNKQMVFLQKQIEQLLKSQESKEKQIEQLLKSHETKENKIEQLLKIQDVKENHIEQLLKAQEKHEKQIEQLILAQEVREKQNIELSKQLKDLNKQSVTTGTVTKIDLADKSTNTSFQHHCQCEVSMEHSGKTNHIQASANCKNSVSREKSFTLYSLDLPVVQTFAPTPQSSIHVDIPEYNGSSDEESDSFSSTSKELQDHPPSDSKSLGYTFYNNVLTQVNDIIHSHNNKENEGIGLSNINHPKQDVALIEAYQRIYNQPYENNSQSNSKDNNQSVNVHEMGDTEYQEGNKMPNSLRGVADPSAHCRMSYNLMKDTQSPSDISLKMNALALKYLKEEQISQYEMQFQSQQNGRQPDVTIYNVTNLSFGTMRYLERYQISSNKSSRTNNNIDSPHQFLHHKAKAVMRNCAGKNMTNV